MATAAKTGGEIDAFCNKCKMTLAHTIIAMVGNKVARVECNTCKSQHAYRGKTARAPRTASSKSAKAAAPSRQSVTFDQLLGQRDVGTARRYSVRDTYAKDDLLEHPTFGYGIVTAVRGDKVEVMFKSFEKVLVHGRAGASAEHAHFEHPKPHHLAATDKPLEGQAPAEEVVEEEEEEEDEERPRPHPPARPA